MKRAGGGGLFIRIIVYQNKSLSALDKDYVITMTYFHLRVLSEVIDRPQKVLFDFYQ